MAIDAGMGRKFYDTALSAPTDRAGKVQRGPKGRASRQNKVAQGWEAFAHEIHEVFEGVGLSLAHEDHAFETLRKGCGQVGADVEKIMLDES
jgi:hypothetical protein